MLAANNVAIKMKILIIIPRWFVGDIVNYRYMFPLGLAYISAVLKQAGCQVNCLNLNHYPGRVDSLIEKSLKQAKYDYVCTGGISTFYNQIKTVIDAVRQADPAVGIVLGGGVVSSEPELIFNALGPNFAIIGEGENTIKELFDCLLQQGDLNSVAGIAYRSADGRFVCNRAPAPIAEIDSLPYPDFSGFEFERYLDHLHPSDQFAYDLYD